jgi:hypothetical protein
MPGRIFPQAFIEDDGGCGGEVETANVPGNGDVVGGSRILIQDRCRQPFCFRTEYQEQSGGRWHRPEWGCTVFSEKDDFFCAYLKRGSETLKIIPGIQIDFGPVVEAGPFNLPAVKGKTQGTDQVQAGAGTDAGAAYVAGVPVHIRVHQNYMAFKGFPGIIGFYGQIGFPVYR